MTEQKGKRRYWRRRRPHRKPGNESPGPATTGTQNGGSLPSADLATGETEPSQEAPVIQETTVEIPATGGGDEGRPVSEEAAPAKSRRRRSRRRGVRKEPAQQASPPADGPYPPAENIPVERVTHPETEKPEAEAPAAGEGDVPKTGEAGGILRKGRRRGRRRSRRREGQAAVAAPEGEAPPGVAAEKEDFEGGAEGTSSEETAAFDAVTETEASGEEAREKAEEEDREGEEGEPVPAKGPRKVMLIDGTHPEEIRVAIVSDSVLDYFEVENQRRKQFKGNIYKGKVVNVAHAIEAAFVEFGGGRHGFLPLNEYCAGALMEHLGSWNEGDKRPHLRPGTEILVQVTKEESSIKGAALTSYISIAGRYLVMMLGMKRYGISKKITGDKERERIRKNMEKLTYPEHLGFIVRTVGAGQPLKDLRADLENLLKLWNRTVDGARTQKAPALLYEEQDIVVRALRDNYSSDVSEVLMNSPDSYRKAQAFFDVYYPKQKQKLKLVRQKRPLFSKFNLDEQVERACGRKVSLPSGGHIVIDRSEALWSIDVNSGRSSRDRDIEDTAYRTNKEAAAEVARQLRVRDMGGLIVVDFIDMENRHHIKDVEKTLKDALKRDKAKSDISSMGKFGLVALSRQRMGISFYDVVLRECDRCGGTGLLSTADAAIVRLLRFVHDGLSKEQTKELVVRVSPGLLESLLNQKRDEITSLERMCGGRVSFVADPALPNGSFSRGEETT